MASGVVKWFAEDRGYGFIKPDGGGDDVFVHFSGIAGSGHRTLNKGDAVTYGTSSNEKGVHATNVVVAAPA